MSANVQQTPGTEGVKFVQWPRAVGYWRIGGPHGMCVHITQRPRWLTRWLMRLLLEWQWEDLP